ncbi:MAG: DUF1501 domain-containing protein [Planctomycetota bacterium]|nr:MAG: DUF1501 domain-containing protein [Planctomycetota bacterium]
MHRHPPTAHAGHAFGFLRPRQREGLVSYSRRSVLKASLAGMAGLTLPGVLAARSAAAREGAAPGGKSVILIWMTGGPSHIDTWDVKPQAPPEIRGPFGTIATKLPGIRFCEFLPKQAAMMDRLTVIRSVDARFSNHEPNQVFQTGNRAASPRTNREGDKFPAIASIAAKHAGPLRRDMPPSVVLNMKSRSHVAWGGYLGKEYDPFLGNEVQGLFELPAGLDQTRIRSRHDLQQQFDRLRRDLDLSGSMQALDRFEQQAIDIVAGQKAQQVFDLSQEPAAVRERYGSHDWCQQALLARRLVEAGVSFVTIDLSNHGASGTWDTHGDNIPPYGGIWNGLRPLLPVFDHLLTTLVSDLEQRGLADDVLVIAMGEFGRTPQIGTQGSSDGRNHWPVVMSMTLAGGGMRHGQVIGSTERDGGQIKERPVTPSDLAATIYRHMGVPLDGTYLDSRGRPRYYVEDGEPIRELV